MAEERCPEISVIVPVYKVEKYLNECINSILVQTFAQFELILVDDGSPDSCPALCDAAALQDDRVRVIHQRNKGLSAARNAGMKIARGKWVAFVDSDDRVMPGYLERMYAAAQKAEPDLVVCDYLCMDENGAGKAKSEKLVRAEQLGREELIRKMCLTPFAVAWTKLYRREILEKMQFPEGKLYEDAMFAAKLYPTLRKAVCIPEALYCYRCNGASIMHSKRTVQNLEDQVAANYAMFTCAREQGLTDVLCVYYWLIVKYFVQNWRAITPAERKSPQAQKALECRRTAWRQLKQSGAVTPAHVFLAAVHRVAPALYLRMRHGEKK